MNKKLGIFAVIAVLLLGIVVLKGKKSYGPDRDEMLGKPFIHVLPKISHITITDKSASLNLKEVDDLWVVTEKHNYPANLSKIETLMKDIQELKANVLYTSKTSEHGKYKVLDPAKDKSDKSGTKIELKDDSGKTVVGIIIGESKKSNKKSNNQFGFTGSGNFVRMADKDSVYLSNSSLSTNPAPSNWIKKGIMKIDKDEIRSIEVIRPKEKYTIERKTKKDDFKLKSNMEQKDWAVKNVATAAESLDMETILTPAEAKDYKLLNKHILKTYSGIVYTFEVSDSIEDKSKQHCFKMSASYEDPPKVEVSPKKDKKDDKDKKDKKDDKDDEKKDDVDKPKYSKEEAQKEIEKFNKKHAQWLYLISDWTSKNFIKEFKDLIETEVMKIDEDEIQSIEVIRPNEKYTIARKTKKDDFKLKSKEKTEG